MDFRSWKASLKLAQLQLHFVHMAMQQSLLSSEQIIAAEVDSAADANDKFLSVVS